MEERYRKKEPCTTYRREGRNKETVYECLSPTLETQGDSGGRNYRGGGRVNQDIYECCPPTPVELRCSVCYTAERDGCNLWTCVPFVSYSVLCGPTLADLLVNLLNLMPLSFLACLGIAHPRCCSAKPKPPKINCNPERTRCPPANRCPPPMNKCAPPVTRCPPPVNMGAEKPDIRRPCPCPPGPRFDVDIGDGNRYGNDDKLTDWMQSEYESLARELAEIKILTNEDEPNYVDSNRNMLEARNYVLDRLAEMLAKREEIQKRHQQRARKG